MCKDERRVAVVTGGARGIGFATSQLLVREGFRVAIFDKNDDKPLECAAWLKTNKSASAFFVADITEFSVIADTFALVAARFGRIDALVNNAAISPKGPAGEKILSWDICIEEWTEVFRVNVFGAIHCINAVLPYLRQLGEGSIVNIGSMMGTCGASQSEEAESFPASNSGAHYCASKASIHNITKSFARELAHVGIRVNCVAPGAVDSGMTVLRGSLPDRVKAQIPIGRLCSATEIALCVLYLIDPGRSPGVTGHILNVNGGWMM